MVLCLKRNSQKGIQCKSGTVPAAVIFTNNYLSSEMPLTKVLGRLIDSEESQKTCHINVSHNFREEELMR